MRVGVGGQLDADPGLQDLDLGGQHGHRCGQDSGDAGMSGPVLPGRAVGRGPQPRAQHAGRSRVAPRREGLQPAVDGLLIELASGVLTAEAGQERQADRAAQVEEQPDRGGERHGQVGAQLVACRHPVRDQILAGPHRGAQRGRRGRVRDQRPQPGPVGAQRVGQHERIEPVVLGPGRPVPRPQVLHLPGGDHHHGQARGQQRLDERAVAPLDRDLGDPGLPQPQDQRTDARLVMSGAEPAGDPPGHIDHAHLVISGGPVNAGHHAAGRIIRQNLDWGILHHSLLAAKPSGEAPLFTEPGRRRQLTVRRSKRKALSTIGASRVTTRPAKLVLDLTDGSCSNRR